MTQLDVQAAAAAGPEPAPRRALLGDRSRLVVLSFLMLFLELALIRWSGSNVLFLSYFSNFVLLGSFLGIGLGFLRGKATRDFTRFAPLALAALVAFVWWVPLNIKVNGGGNLVFFGGDPNRSGLPREVVLPIIFLLVAGVMALIGEMVARTFARFEALDAYKFDLLGSVLGIAAFSALSFLRVPPIGWGLVVTAVFVVVGLPEIRVPRRLAYLVPLVLVIGVLGWESARPNTFWSPYYKIRTERMADGNTFVWVNRLPHQFHQKARAISQPPGVTGVPGATVYSMATPKALDNVLVIGAGGGNDVSAALIKGAKHVDAVEIDPKLYELGRDRHPNHPYQDPRVSIHITDGRAFLERTNTKYDLVLLALPDSLTLVAGQSSLRLESYLFTKEALTSARQALKPDGVFAMYNYYRERWLADRYAGTLNQVYGRAPCEISAGTGTTQLGFFADSPNPASLDCPAPASQAAQPHRWVSQTNPVPAPATDDHPFPYLRDRSLPTFYAFTLLFILAASALLVRGVAGGFKPMIRFIDLFFMGAAFLLLETKYVVQFALLFGTTWFVNALVFLGVLLSVLLAVSVSRRVRLRRPEVLYVVLLASLIVAFVIPLDALLGLAPVPRFVVAATLAFFPIFTANLVFVERFKATASTTEAFGANLLGAMVGGVVEYASLIIGYRWLLVLVAILYGLAFLTGRRHLGADRPMPAARP